MVPSGPWRQSRSLSWRRGRTCRQGCQVLRKESLGKVRGWYAQFLVASPVATRHLHSPSANIWKSGCVRVCFCVVCMCDHVPREGFQSLIFRLMEHHLPSLDSSSLRSGLTQDQRSHLRRKGVPASYHGPNGCGIRRTRNRTTILTSYAWMVIPFRKFNDSGLRIC